MLPSAYTMHRKKIRKATMLQSNYFLGNKAKKYIKCMIHKEHINSSKVRYISLGSFFLQCITHTLTHFRHRLLHIFWEGKTRAITTKGHKNIVAMLAPFFPLHVDLTNFLWSKFGLFRLCSCFFFFEVISCLLCWQKLIWFSATVQCTSVILNALIMTD